MVDEIETNRELEKALASPIKRRGKSSLATFVGRSLTFVGEKEATYE